MGRLLDRMPALQHANRRAVRASRLVSESRLGHSIKTAIRLVGRIKVRTNSEW
jgi:hypothetical protein